MNEEKKKKESSFFPPILRRKHHTNRKSDGARARARERRKYNRLLCLQKHSIDQQQSNIEILSFISNHVHCRRRRNETELCRYIGFFSSCFILRDKRENNRDRVTKERKQDVKMIKKKARRVGQNTTKEAVLVKENNVLHFFFFALCTQCRSFFLHHHHHRPRRFYIFIYVLSIDIYSSL